MANAYGSCRSDKFGIPILLHDSRSFFRRLNEDNARPRYCVLDTHIGLSDDRLCSVLQNGPYLPYPLIDM
ncbi:hypothetical protein BGS_0235 [Beggiatoa sp. SS]|nr:hypothetical protein BGS_0235 [Beggiatoa sp. SS]